jgi:ABC-type sugar transport system substrate-binding protein
MKITNLTTSIVTAITFLVMSQLITTALAEDEAKGATKRKVVIGFIGKSLANDVFQVAQVGAKDAARELGQKYNVDVEVQILTPNEEDAVNRPRL